jgi:hypothetical protein
MVSREPCAPRFSHHIRRQQMRPAERNSRSVQERPLCIEEIRWRHYPVTIDDVDIALRDSGTRATPPGGLEGAAPHCRADELRRMVTVSRRRPRTGVREIHVGGGEQIGLKNRELITHELPRPARLRAQYAL